MKQLNFSISINAPVAHVWDTMIGPVTYKVWTTVFCEGSYYEGSWDKGARIRFLSPDGGGMISEVAERRPYEFLSLRHLGYINNGVEDMDSDEVRSWAPAYENYSFRQDDEHTTLDIYVEIESNFEEYMLRTWPAALQTLKTLCEQ